jgi:hypothetical protein
MKLGKSIVELAQEIERQHAVKVDYAADTRKLQIVPADAGVNLVVRNGQDTVLGINDLAHRQISERVGIPAKYYDRMLTSDPELLAYNVNRWFERSPERRMIRTLDGKARAFLSDRYQRIDNSHVAETVLPVLSQVPGIEIVSAEVTERRLYIKAVTHAVRGTINSRRVGDFVEAGVMIANSEVGLGAVTVSPFFNFLACLNGMVRNRDAMRQAHVGTKLTDDDAITAILADDTRRALDRGVLLKVRDVVTAALNQEQFDRAIARMQETVTQEITGDPVKAIEVLADDFGINEGERSSVLRHLITGGDLSRYGLMNAITRTAEDLPSYDRATEFETLGGRLLDLPSSQWNRIAVGRTAVAA